MVPAVPQRFSHFPNMQEVHVLLLLSNMVRFWIHNPSDLKTGPQNPCCEDDGDKGDLSPPLGHSPLHTELPEGPLWPVHTAVARAHGDYLEHAHVG